jgi:hypothetical protein
VAIFRVVNARIQIYLWFLCSVLLCNTLSISNILIHLLNKQTAIIISGFRREADEISILLGYYAAYSGNSSPTFRDTHRPFLQGSRNPRKKLLFSDFLTLEEGADGLSRNVSEELPLYAA